MSTCQDVGCNEPCRACEMAATVEAAAVSVGEQVGAEQLGDMLLVGHIMAMISTIQQQGPLSRLHLCARHRTFTDMQGKAMGINVVIPPHAQVQVNTSAIKGLN